MTPLKLLFLAGLILTLFSSSPAAAQDYASWLAGVREEAVSMGISPSTIQTALRDVPYLPEVIRLDRKQPEGRLTFPEYKKGALNPARIRKGRQLYQEHFPELTKAGVGCVPPQIITALWGMESNYGSNMGNFGIIPALATLSFEGRRAKFFRSELFRALQILDEGHISHADMKGSWAGAMGQSQFMPSSFQRFAVDGNGDGRRDIWHTLPDVFASAANYLCKNGWNPDERWGREVRLLQAVPPSLTGLETRKSLQEWSRLGIVLPDGQPLPDNNMLASLVIPEGSETAFLAYDNYRVIMRWNKSVYFATSVGLLSDAIASPG